MRRYYPNLLATMLLVALAPLFVVGCGKGDMPDIGPVSGVVTLDSKPLVGTMVLFRPEAGRQSSARTDENGRYELKYIRDVMGAVVGSHKVIIRTANEDSSAERLPPRYNRQTTLTAEVTPEANTIDFSLKSH